MFIDTHCHIDDQKIVDLDDVVSDYLKDGVDTVINMACNLNSCATGMALSQKYPSVYFASGFHPSDANDVTNEDLYRLKSYLTQDKCVAVGEIGLDYHWDGFDKQKQKQVFISQIELAKEFKLPVSIHSRDATEDMINILKDNKDKLVYGAVMHCFSGSKETASQLLKLGLYISFAGTLTFKNAKNLVEVAEFVPSDYCLTETDSPYLAPHPFRGTLNTPKNVSLVCARLAEIKGVPIEQMASAVKENAKRLFKKL